MKTFFLFYFYDVIIQIAHRFLQTVVDQTQGGVVHNDKVLWRLVVVLRSQFDGCYWLLVYHFVNGLLLAFRGECLVLSGSFSIQIGHIQCVGSIYSIGSSVQCQHIVYAWSVCCRQCTCIDLRSFCDRITYKSKAVSLSFCGLVGL